jgi:YHS domain-containing protein
MRKTTSLKLMAAIVLFWSVGVEGADAPKLLCPVSGKAASKEHAVAHNGGQVYFCCENCPKAFAAKTQKYTAKANAQMVQTGQFKQVKCPLTGKPLNPNTTLEIASVKVQFCCNNCRGNVLNEQRRERVDVVFNDAAFKRGFEKVAPSDTAKEEPKK